MSNVENRVVELEMRNSSLEKGANKSIKTLDKLDKALDFKNGKRSFEDVEKAAEKCNFEPLLKAADTVQDRFSTLGIVGVRALERITDKAVDAGIALAKSLTIDQITSGYSKYEQKTASVQTLMNSTGKSLEEVNGYLARLMWFSDETSYGFTDMTSALATMTSSGGDIDKLIPMIEGVANAVAFAGKGASEFQRVMYNLNQSYSGGYLTLMDWKSVEQSGAASAQLKQVIIDTAVSLGKIKEGKVTVDNFNNKLASKFADRDVMEQAFGYFDEMTQKAYEMIGTLDEQGNEISTASRAYEILAEQYDGVSIRAAKAAQEAKTFGEAIDATKDAVSSSWMRIFESIFGNYEQQKGLWTDLANSLYDIFAAPLDSIGDIINDAFQSTPVAKFADKLEEAGVSFDAFKNKAKEVAKVLGFELDESIDEVENFEDLLAFDGVSSDVITKTLDAFSAEGATGLVETEVNALELAKRLNSGEFGYGIEAMTKNLKAAGFEIEHARDVYRISANDANATFKQVSEGAIEASEETQQALKDAYELANDLSTEYYKSSSGWKIGWDAVRNVLGAVGDRLDAIKTAWNNTFSGPTADGIKNAIISFHKWSESLKMGEEEGEKITGTFSRVFGILKRIVGIIGKTGTTAGRVVKSVKTTISKILKTPMVQRIFKYVADAFDSILVKIEGWAGDVDYYLAQAFEYLDAVDWEKVTNGLEPLITLAKKLRGVIRKVSGAFVSFGIAALPYLESIGEYIWNNIVSPFSAFIVELIESDDPIKTFKDGVISCFEKIKKKFEDFVSAIKGGKLNEIFTDLIDGMGPVWEKFEALKATFKNVAENAKAAFGDLDLGKMISIVALGALLVVISNISNAFKKVGDAAGQITGTFKNINNIISSKVGSSFAANAKTLAGAVVAIAASLYILSTIPKDRLTPVAVTLGIIMVVFGILAGVMTFAAKKMGVVQVKKVETLTRPILALSAALLILCLAAKNASAAVGTEPTWKRVGTILALIGGLGLELVGLAWLMTLVSGKISVGAIIMMLVAVAILKLAQAIKLLENLKLSDDAKGIFGLIAVVAAIGLAMSMIGKLSNGAKFSTFVNLGIGILAIVASLYLATRAIETISNANFETTFGEFFGAFIGVAVGIGIVIAVIAVIGKKLESAAKSIAMVCAGILLMVGAVYLMTFVVDKLAKMPDNGNTANAILGVVMIGIVVAAMVAALGYASSISNGGKGVIKIVAAVAMMVLVVGAMTLLMVALTAFVSSGSTETIWETVGIIAALAVLVSGVAIAVGFASKLGGGKGVGILIGVIASVVAMAAVLIILTNFSWDQILPGLAAIAGCLIALGATMLLIGLAVKAATSNKGGVTGLIGAVLILGVVALALAVLASYNWESLGVAAAAMCAVLIVLAVSMVILGDAKFNLGATLAAVGIMIAIFAGLYFVIPQLEALAKLDTGSLLKNMAILVGAVFIIALIIGALAAVTALVPGMTAALGVLGVILVAMAATMAVVFLGIAAVIAVFTASMYILQSVDFAAIANGLTQLVNPMLSLGAAGIVLIIGAIGVIAIAAAIVLLGLAGTLSADGITTFHVVLISLLNTLSAVGNAFQNAGGSIIGGLANLRDELDKSADATGETSKKLWGILTGGDTQNDVDVSAITGAVTVAGEAASEEATTQGENIGAALTDGIGEGLELSADGLLGDLDLSSIGIGGGTDLGSGFTEGFGDSFDLQSLLGGEGSEGSATSLLGDMDFSSLGLSGGTDFLSGFTGGVTSNTESTQEAGADVGTTLNQSINSTIESGAEETSNSIFTMLTNAVGMIDMESIGNIVSGNFMNSLGESFLSESGVDSETLSGNFLPLIQKMVDNTDLSGTGENMGDVITEAFCDSLESTSNQLEVSDSAKSLGNEANEGAQQVDTTASGSYWGEGLNNGMWSWADRIWKTAYNIGKKAVDGVKTATEEGSPCETTIRSGKFFGEGLVIGIDMLGARVQAAGYTMGMRAAMAVEDGIQNGNADGIVPVLDMSDVYSTLSDFDDTYRPVIKPTLDMSGMDPSFMNMQAVVSHKSTGTSSVDAGTSRTVSPTSFNFTQNNYSPKALSRVAIYRQTKNQFSAVKDMIKK